jgi:hypothetical protein
MAIEQFDDAGLQCRRGADSEDDFWAGLTGKQFDDLALQNGRGWFLRG